MTNAVSSQLPTESALAQHLLVMIMGVAQTSVLCTAAQLGLADHLKDGLVDEMRRPWVALRQPVGPQPGLLPL